MSPKYHIAASTVISGILYAVFNSWAMSASSFVTGILIDIDHIVDYSIAHGLRIDIKDFFKFFYEERYRRITLILHGWEWLLILVIAAWLVDWNLWVTGALIGWSQHMFFDKIYNISNFSSYSLLWRFYRGFNSDNILLRNRRWSGRGTNKKT
jgi:hypothetical protein